MSLDKNPVEWAEKTAGSKTRLWACITYHLILLALGFGAMYWFGVKGATSLPPEFVVMVVMRAGLVPMLIVGLAAPTLYLGCIHLLVVKIKMIRLP